MGTCKLLTSALSAIFLAACATPAIDTISSEQAARNSAIAEAAFMAQTGIQFFDEHGEPTFIDNVKASVRDKLNDPDSATFRKIRVVSFRGGKALCGEVNAKNKFGGYAGYQQFYAIPGQVRFRTANEQYPNAMVEAGNAGLIVACM